MRIAIMGSGGVGGFVGARLAHAGCDVRFVARGAHLEAMQRDGLTIDSDAQPPVRVAPVRASADPAAIGPVDLVLIAVKLRDMEAAAEAVRPLVGPQTAVLSLQNGVTKDDILRARFGAQAVIGGVAYVASELARPGVIRQTGTMQRVVVGEYDGAKSERVLGLVDWLRRAGIDAAVSDDIRRTLWEKFVFLVALSSTTATTRTTLGPILAHPRGCALFLDLMREVVAVGRALGVRLPADYAEERLAFARTLPYAMTSSLYHDLAAGRALEVEWLAGAVVELGEQCGVPTPLNRAVRDILAVHANGR